MGLVDENIFWIKGVIAVLIIAIITFLFLIIFYRMRLILFEQKLIKFKSVLRTLLSGVLNNPNRRDYYYKRIDTLVIRKWQYDVLLNQLVKICYSFKGTHYNRAVELYRHFELKQNSIEKIHSGKWYKTVKGIVELSLMGGEASYKLIVHLVNDKNFYVRKQAEIAIVQIGKIDGLMRLENRMGTISYWTILSVLSILQRNAFKLTDYDIKRLKNSYNPTTRLLAQHLGNFSVTY